MVKCQYNTMKIDKTHNRCYWYTSWSILYNGGYNEYRCTLLLYGTNNISNDWIKYISRQLFGKLIPT